jgi:hypothetical protein
MDRDIAVPLVDYAEVTAKAATTELEHDRLDAVRPILPEVRARRENAGGERWYVYRDDPDDFFYTGWTYSRSLIVQEKPPIQLEIPEGYAQFEDAWILPGKRNAGAVQIAIDAIAEQLRDRGIHHLISKMDVENAQVIRAAIKNQWRMVARVRGTMWLRHWTTWRVEAIEPEVPQLAELDRRRVL